MGKRVIVGAGQVGRHARIAADATDRDRLTPGAPRQVRPPSRAALTYSKPLAALSEYLGIRRSATPSNVPALSSGFTQDLVGATLTACQPRIMKAEPAMICPIDSENVPSVGGRNKVTGIETINNPAAHRG